MLRRASFVLFVCSLLVAPASAEEVQHIVGSGVMPSGMPFSDAVRVGDLVFLSGHLGNKPGQLELVEGGMEAEARQTLDNIGATLKACGLTFADVIKCTVMLADISEWGAFNTVYAEYFEAPFPARSALGVNGLALGARVEVECIAVARQKP